MQPDRTGPSSKAEAAKRNLPRPGAAHLKFLHRKRQIPSRNFKWKSGARIAGLLVPITFRSSLKVRAEVVHELRKVGTSEVRRDTLPLIGMPTPTRPVAVWYRGQ